MFFGNDTWKSLHFHVLGIMRQAQQAVFIFSHAMLVLQLHLHLIMVHGKTEFVIILMCSLHDDWIFWFLCVNIFLSLR